MGGFVHQNAFGVVHISKRDFKKKEVAGGVIGGAVGTGAGAAAYKSIKDLTEPYTKVEPVMSRNTAEAIMNGGSEGVKAAKVNIAVHHNMKLLRRLNSKKNIIGAGLIGAGTGAYASHKIRGRKTKLR